MKTQSPFSRLRKIFQERFFEDDTVSPGSGFETNIYQVLGFLAAVGFFVAYFAMPAFMGLSFQKRTPADDWALRDFRLFFPALSFAVIGFATVFQWDTLFPDRRDFLILSLFPVSLREVLAAKFAALGAFLGLLIAALNIFPTLGTVLSCLFRADAWGFGLRLVTAQVAATAGSAAFAFLLVATFQGVLINVTSPRIFRRVSPAIQMFGMSLMVLSIATFPIYVMLLKPAAEAHRAWLWLFPPVWFTGFYDLLLPGGDPFFASLGVYGIRSLALIFGVFCLTWAAGFRRHVRRTLESEDTMARRPARISSALRSLAVTPEEWAIFTFCRKTLARSTKHRLFLATWIAVGLSIGLLTVLSVKSGSFTWSPDGMRAFPFLMAFFVISGFRTVFQFPADLACNWQLQMAESRWAETGRRASRKVVLVTGLRPVLLAFLPFEVLAGGLAVALMHMLFQLAAGMLLIELMFWKFDRVPFTCSYFAGKTSLSILAVLYLYGFTTYSSNLSDLERAVEGHAAWQAIILAAAVAALAILWHRNPAASEVIFDGSEPVIQTLNLN